MIGTRRKSTVPMYVRMYVCVMLCHPRVHHACALDIRYIMSLSTSAKLQGKCWQPNVNSKDCTSKP